MSGRFERSVFGPGEAGVQELAEWVDDRGGELVPPPAPGAGWMVCVPQREGRGAPEPLVYPGQVVVWDGWLRCFAVVGSLVEFEREYGSGEGS